MAVSLDIAANPATGPTLTDPSAEYVVGGPWGGFTVNGGFLIAGAVDDVVAQFGPRVYELMEYDDAVSSALYLLTAAALGEGVRVAPAVTVNPGEVVTARQRRRDERLAEEVSAYCARQVTRVRPDLDTTLWQLYGGLAAGCKMAEVVTEDGEGQDAGRYVLKRLAVKPNWTWAFRVDPFLEVKRLRCWTVEGWVDVDRGKFVVFSWRPRDNDPRGTSLLRPAYMAFNLKTQTFPDYGEFLKKFASAGLILTAGPDMQDTTTIDPLTGMLQKVTVEDKMLKAGRDFRNHLVLALPHGATATVLESKGNGEAFGGGFDRFDRSIFRSIVMGTRPFQEAQHGSKADTGDVMDLFGMAVAQCRKPMLAAVRRDLLFRLVELNWGPEAARRYTPEVSFGLPDHVSPDLMRAFADAWQKGVFDGAQRAWIWQKLGAPAVPVDRMEGPGGAGDGDPRDRGEPAEGEDEKSGPGRPPAAGESDGAGPEPANGAAPGANGAAPGANGAALRPRGASR